ncbi:MAG: M56 family metallopeptidase [Lachnospiraceae bacterium]|nr:M56 family metallopeptidase [Lachnospiraceae bacterium]
MHFSFSTIYTAVLSSNVLLILAAVFLQNKSLLFKTGYKCLGIFLSLAAIRLVFPFEFPFTRNIYLPEGISYVIASFHGPLFSIADFKITPLILLCVVWIGGVVYQLFRFIREFILMDRYILYNGRDITTDPACLSVLSRIPKLAGRHVSFRIFRLKGISSPMLYDMIAPRILLPDDMNFSDQELYFILSHEISHYVHRDLLLKYAIRLITILYWWNPACHFLKRQTELLCEIRIDGELAASGPAAAGAYMKCLLDVAESAVKKAPLPSSMYIGFKPQNAVNLKKRFEWIISGKHPRRSVQFGLTVFIFLFFAFSYLYILEGSIPLPEPAEENGVLFQDDIYNYIIQNEFGTYDIYYHGMYTETIDSLFGYEDAVIYHSKEEVPHETNNQP